MTKNSRTESICIADIETAAETARVASAEGWYDTEDAYAMALVGHRYDAALGLGVPEVETVLAARKVASADAAHIATASPAAIAALCAAIRALYLFAVEVDTEIYLPGVQKFSSGENVLAHYGITVSREGW